MGASLRAKVIVRHKPSLSSEAFEIEWIGVEVADVVAPMMWREATATFTGLNRRPVYGPIIVIIFYPTPSL